MEEKTKEKIINYLILLILVMLVFWNFSLNSKNAKLGNNVNEINRVLLLVDERLDNSFDYQRILWLSENNLTEHNWVDSFECTTYRNLLPDDIKVFSMNDGAISVNILIDDAKYNLLYYSDGGIDCFLKGWETSCKNVFCAGNRGIGELQKEIGVI